jgi:hypothetical protein
MSDQYVSASDPTTTMSTPAEHGVVVINGMPAQSFAKKRKTCRRPYYTATPANEHAPFIAHAHDLAMQSPDDSVDRANVVEGLAPFFTSFNGIEEADRPSLTPLRFIGVVISDTPDDRASDQQPTPSALQIGGICTIRNTGNQTIKIGDVVAIRMPERENKDDMWHVSNPGVNDSARGVIRPITYPLTKEQVSVATAAAAAARNAGNVLALGRGAITEMISTGDTGKLTAAGLVGAFATGMAMAALLEDCDGYQLANEPIATRVAGVAELFGMPLPAVNGGRPLVFDTPEHKTAARKRLTELALCMLLPDTPIPQGWDAAATQLFKSIKTTSGETLMMLAQAIAQHGRFLRGTIVGVAMKPAARGEAFDIKLGEYMI